MSPSSRLRFGIFLAPFHRPGENPTLALKRDLELVQWLDTLGYDEAWVGEHHSAGWETIASPELFIATAAERTRRIKLGTGVISLPYHHPLMVADRIVLLDHLTEGRVMLGVGPGALVTDALMLGIEPELQRPRMEESLDVIMRLMTDPTPFSYRADWFELNEAILQLRPFHEPHPPVAVASMQTPAGVLLAGKHGAAVLSLSVFNGARGAVDLQAMWAIAEESAQRHGKTMQREEWRLVVPVHLAETRREALDAARSGAASYVFDYSSATLGRPAPNVSRDALIDQMVDSGSWIVGTPDDCIAGIERLRERSGGFGGLLVQTVDWAPREALLRSYELLARYVMPRFQGSLVGIEASNQLARGHAFHLQEVRQSAVEAAHQSYEQRQVVARP